MGMKEWVAGETEGLVKPRIRECPGCKREIITALYTDRWGVTARVILPHQGYSRSLTIDQQSVRRHRGKQELPSKCNRTPRYIRKFPPL